MVDYIIQKYVKNYEDTQDIQVKGQVGRICGFVGIFFNILLFIIKFVIGIIVHSVSIQADAINNLTDSGSTILSILSFYFANKPADKEHPFGHERLETISSFVISIVIGYLGLRMLEESFLSILHPSKIIFKWMTIFILLISIGIKLYMYLYNKNLSEKYQSPLLKATALDSISDVIGTLAVLLATLFSPILHFNLDGYVGVVVSLVILYGAYQLLKENVDSLLGQAPDKKLVDELEERLLKEDYVFGVHDIVVHQYGQNKIFASAHLEVDSNSDMIDVHDHIDNLEREIKDQMNIELVIHMDPLLINDPDTMFYRNHLEQAIKELNKPWSFHDFRIIKGKTHTNLVFDLLVPFDEECTKKEMTHMLMEHMHVNHPIYLVMEIDNPMV